MKKLNPNSTRRQTGYKHSKVLMGDGGCKHTRGDWESEHSWGQQGTGEQNLDNKIKLNIGHKK